MESDAAKARWSRLHDDRSWHDGTFKSWAAKPSDAHPYYRDFGVTIGVTTTDIRPGDTFLTVEACGPVESAPVSDVLHDEHDRADASAEDQHDAGD